MTVRAIRAQAPQPTTVETDAAGRPRRVEGRAVLAIREEWRVEEGWWERPTRRRYFEVVLEDGSLRVLYEDRRERRWWRHGR